MFPRWFVGRSLVSQLLNEIVTKKTDGTRPFDYISSATGDMDSQKTIDKWINNIRDMFE